MACILNDAEYIAISTATKETLEAWKRGVHLFTTSGAAIPDLMQVVTASRWRFAESIRLQGHVVLALQQPPFRLAINRFYYAMYHSMRAVVYYAHGGDDHEKHSVLSTKVPTDFPDSEQWQNKIKSARLYRNNADYDSYPPADATFQAVAFALRGQADELLSLTQGYLRLKGCSHV